MGIRYTQQWKDVFSFVLTVLVKNKSVLPDPVYYYAPALTSQKTEKIYIEKGWRGT